MSGVSRPPAFSHLMVGLVFRDCLNLSRHKPKKDHDLLNPWLIYDLISFIGVLRQGILRNGVTFARDVMDIQGLRKAAELVKAGRASANETRYLGNIKFDAVRSPKVRAENLQDSGELFTGLNL